MTHDYVADEETLYRAAFYGKKCYKIQDNKAIVSSQAFTDREMRPSVDRANLCDNNPRYSQKTEKDGVVSLITKDIRMTDTVIQNNSKGEAEFQYKIDVYPRPLESNYAHAQIEPCPEYRNRKPFRKLLERLAYLANERGWEIEPWETRK